MGELVSTLRGTGSAPPGSDPRSPFDHSSTLSSASSVPRPGLGTEVTWLNGTQNRGDRHTAGVCQHMCATHMPAPAMPAPPRSPLGFLVSQSFSTRESIAESPSRNALGPLTTQPGLPPELRRAEVDTTRLRARPTAPGPTRPSLSLSPIPGPAPPGVGEQGRLGPLAKRYLGAVPRPASCRLSGAMGSETCEWVLGGGRCGRVSTLQPGPAPAKPPTAVWSFLTLVRELETW